MRILKKRLVRITELLTFWDVFFFFDFSILWQLEILHFSFDQGQL